MSALDRDIPFAFTADASFFEKANAEPGKRRRVAGIMSTEEEDQEGEVILQKGIDWSYFLTKGFFNEHHDKTIDGLIGYPEQLQPFRAGAELPDGEIAKANCTWVEGHLLEGDERADKIWKKAIALRNTPRKLGFSIEGRSRARSQDGKTVIKSMVRHCAITHMPVNAGSGLSAFMKAISVAEAAKPEDLERAWLMFAESISAGSFAKSITVGEADSIIVPTGPLTGEGVARLTSRRDAPGKRRRRKHNSISKAQAVEYVLDRCPGLSNEKARRIVEIIERSRRRTP